MDAVNRLATRLFNMLLGPLERLGIEWTILLFGAVFGVVGLLIFKLISPQRTIRHTKDRIKGHLIEIRLYQNDLGLVSKAIAKVMALNLKYLALNLGPLIPLAIPFTLVAGQLVARYGFDPVPVSEQHTHQLAGQGVTLELRFAQDEVAKVRDLKIQLPEGLVAVSPLVSVPEQGLAFQELVATSSGLQEITVILGERATVKTLWAGDPQTLGRPRIAMQPVRVTGWERMLWPAEDGLGAATLLDRISFVYPERELGWLPGKGPFGVLMWFILASMGFGALVIRRLNVAI